MSIQRFTWYEAPLWYFWETKINSRCDFLILQITGKKFYLSIFDWLATPSNYTNNNDLMLSIVDEVFTIVRVKTPQWECLNFFTVFNSVSVNCFQVNVYNENSSKLFGNIFWTLAFTGSFYRLLELWHFSDEFIEKWYKQLLLLKLPISRFDFAIDFLFNNVPDFPSIKEFFPLVKDSRLQRTWSTNAQLNSWGIWRKVNGTTYIRLYNKFVEISDPEWIYLYWDYLKDYKSVYRLEYEFRHKFTNYTWDQDELYDKILWYTWLEDKKYLTYTPRIELDLSDEIHKLRYIKIFLKMAENLEKNWLDPITLITEHFDNSNSL